MSHESSVTIQKAGNGWYVVNSHDGSILGGPYPTPHEADNYAQIRTHMFDMPEGQEHGAPGMGLNGLNETFGQGYEMPDTYEDNDVEPNPTEFGPMRKDPMGDPYILRKESTYTADSRKPSYEIPAKPEFGLAKPGLGQLAQVPQLDPRLQKMLDDAEKGYKQPGPSQKYLPSPGRPPMGPMPNPSVPPSDPSKPMPGENESEYIKRILRGG